MLVYVLVWVVETLGLEALPCHQTPKLWCRLSVLLLCVNCLCSCWFVACPFDVSCANFVRAQMFKFVVAGCQSL